MHRTLRPIGVKIGVREPKVVDMRVYNTLPTVVSDFFLT